MSLEKVNHRSISMKLQKRPATRNEGILGDACTYEIRVEGRMAETWSNWFEGMKMTYRGNVTILVGEVVDESAVRGILNKIWDLNLVLISVYRIEKDKKQKHEMRLKVGRKDINAKGGEKR